MEALRLVGFKSHYQVSEALTVTELSKHQFKKLVPAGEMPDKKVPIFLVYKTTGLVIIQKLYQLAITYLSLFILQSVCLAA